MPKENKFSNYSMEMEQSTVRLITILLICLSLSFYLFSAYFEKEHVPKFFLMGSLYLVAFLFANALIHRYIVYKSTNNSELRIVYTTMSDICGLGAVVSLSGKYYLIATAYLLWVTFGYGYRFGQKYLFLSQSLSLVMFFIGTRYNYYLNNEIELQIAGYVMILILPLYVNMMIVRLKKSNDEIKEMNGLKDRFFGVIKNDFVYAIKKIINISGNMKETNISKKMELDLIQMDSACKNLIDMVNKVNFYNLLEQDNLVLNNQRYSLDEFIEDLNIKYSQMFLEKNLTFNINYLHKNIFMECDKERLNQIFFILFENAVENTNTGGVTLKCEVSKNLASFYIEDSGCGIEESKLEKVFEVFNADKSINKNGHNIGLGLTICKFLVDKIGGQIDIKSKLGVGTKVTLSLNIIRS